MNTSSAPQSHSGQAAAPGTKRAVLSWCLFDWANSPFVAVITTFVFAAYFTNAIAPTSEIGTAEWGFMMGMAAFAVAVLSPVLGAIADHGGRRKPWLIGSTLIMAGGSALLWWAEPGPGSMLFVLIVVGVSVVAFELGMVFYNAMLPGLVDERWMGRISGWAWGLGYVGGLACLILGLVVFIQPETPPFGLSKATAEHVRIIGPIVGIWAIVFGLPLFFFTPDSQQERQPIGRAVGAGLRQLWTTLREVRRFREIVKFLIARMLFMDGVNTLFIFGGVYAVGTFGMSVQEVLVFGIVLNVTAGLGAFVFGWIDDRLGAKPTILLGLVGILAFGVPLLLIESKLYFYILGAFIGLFFGPVQAASRSLMARIAPKGMETEMFGLYAFSGKSTAFLGPWVVGIVAAFADQRWAMATVLPFIVVGALLLLTVRTKRVDPDTVL